MVDGSRITVAGVFLILAIISEYTATAAIAKRDAIKTFLPVDSKKYEIDAEIRPPNVA